MAPLNVKLNVKSPLKIKNLHRKATPKASLNIPTPTPKASLNIPTLTPDQTPNQPPTEPTPNQPPTEPTPNQPPTELTPTPSEETEPTPDVQTNLARVFNKVSQNVLRENLNPVETAKKSLFNKIPNIRGEIDSRGSILNKLFLLFLGIIIIAVSSSGYYVKKHCTDPSIKINSTIVEFFMGFGTGLIFYIVFDILKIVSDPIIVIFGLFLSVIGSIYINVYNKMGPECTENTIGPELSIGILGCGIGIITFALLYTVLNFLKNPIIKMQIISLITTIFLIIIPSIIINMTNKCSQYDDNVDQKTLSSLKTGQIITLVIGLLIFVGICISFATGI
jgi:hypothetical protein